MYGNVGVSFSFNQLFLKLFKRFFSSRSLPFIQLPFVDIVLDHFAPFDR